MKRVLLFLPDDIDIHMHFIRAAVLVGFLLPGWQPLLKLVYSVLAGIEAFMAMR